MSNADFDAYLMARWATLGHRFAGADLKSRVTPGSRRLWTAKLITHKNSNAEYRIECAGDTWQEAVKGVVVRVDEIEAKP